MLDTTRGVAVLGILLMNIVGFGLPDAYEDPTVWGGHEGANLAVWQTMSLFFEGTMRGLFTLLFGAGALLFLQKHAAREPAALSGTKLYFRRTALLIVFGLINGYLLLWEGDILFFYGVVGLFLYLFRNLSTPRLLMIGIVVLAAPTLVNVMQRADYMDTRARAEAAEALRASGTPLSADQQLAIKAFQEWNDDRKPAAAEIENAIAQVSGSYASAFHYLKGRTFYWETSFFVRYGFAESLGMMLIGMALLKLGVLTGRASARTYLTLMLVGYPIGLAFNLWEMNHLQRADFSVAALMDASVTYDFGRVPMTLAHVGLIGTLWISPVLMHAKRTLAYVGRMALTNYLSQSILCTLLFTGAGLGLFGRLERHELYYVVAADLADAVAVEPMVVTSIPVWSGRVAVADADLWQSATDADCITIGIGKCRLRAARSLPGAQCIERSLLRQDADRSVDCLRLHSIGARRRLRPAPATRRVFCGAFPSLSQICANAHQEIDVHFSSASHRRRKRRRRQVAGIACARSIFHRQRAAIQGFRYRQVSRGAAALLC